MSDYIERERIETFFDGIYDCADLTFEPNDHCCAADDCAHCKWRETMNAIQKCILSIPTADVRPMRRGKWATVYDDFMKSNYDTCACCGKEYFGANGFNFCPNCGADMREVLGDE